MTAEEQHQAIEAFVDACPLHNLRHNTCADGLGGSVCDGDCKYAEKFEHEINNLDKKET